MGGAASAAKTDLQPLGPKETADFYSQPTFQLSRCIDIDKFQQTLGVDPAYYSAYQAQLQNKSAEKQVGSILILKSYNDFKKAARSITIPDSQKREFILQLFNLDPQKCPTLYAVGLKIAQASKQDQTPGCRADGLDLIRKEKVYRKLLQFDFLNRRGLDEVELIVASIFTGNEDAIESSQSMVVQLVGLLLLYLTPSEVFCIIQALVRSSQEQLESEEMKNMIRWHLPLNSEVRQRMHKAFGYSYQMTTIRKKRTLAAHFKLINFSIQTFAKASFDSLTGMFLPLHVVTDFLLMYLVEGVKIVFRYSYSILKCNKDFIRQSCLESRTLVDNLSLNSKTKANVDNVHKWALSYPLKKGNYDLIAAGNEFLDPSLSANLQRKKSQDYMTGVSCSLSYEEICSVWEKMPPQIQTRAPKLIYRASEEGFDLKPTYFEKVKPYAAESNFCLIFIQTVDDLTYGLYLDDILRKWKRGIYSGQFENFMFASVRPNLFVYKPTSINPKDFKNEEKLFEVGPVQSTKSLLHKDPIEGGHCPWISLVKKDIETKDQDSRGSANKTRSSGSASKKQQSAYRLEFRVEVRDEEKKIKDVEIFLL